MSNKVKILVNMFAAIVALFLNILINFVLAPFIVKEVGTEAYGFISFSNQIVGYLSILTVGLNSMSSRFISISYFSEDIEEANQYFSSTFYANLICAFGFIIPLTFGIYYINRIVHVSPSLILDVKLLMAFLSIDFLLTLLFANLNISFYIKNQLYKSSAINALGILVRATVLLLLFSFFPAHIFYIGISVVIVNIITNLCNLYYKIKLVPNLVIRWKYFHLKKVKELLASGVWNSITNIGSTLSDGLDLLIANIFINGTSMGVLALAKMIPSVITQILYAIVSTFMPRLTELYSKKDIDAVVVNIKQSMKITGMLINLPVAVLIAFGDVFFKLWVPSQNAHLLQMLSIITISPWAIIGPATIIHNIFVVLNRIRTNALWVCFTGVLNILTVYFLLKHTSMGLFAVAGVSTIYSILRNLLYTVPFGAIYLNRKWCTFYPEVIKMITSVIVVSLIGIGLKILMPNYTWKYLIVFALLTCVLGFIFNYIIILTKAEKKIVRDMALHMRNRFFGGLRNG